MRGITNDTHTHTPPVASKSNTNDLLIIISSGVIRTVNLCSHTQTQFANFGFNYVYIYVEYNARARIFGMKKGKVDMRRI